MACKLLELPPDVLREIWTSYLSLDDVISFGMTAKNMLDLTWSNSQIVQMERDAPIKNVLWLLSKDLSHLRRLDIYYIPKDDLSEEEIELVPVLFSKLSVLAASKILTNLQTLVTEFNLPENISADMNVIVDLIRNISHLQSLTWYSAKSYSKEKVQEVDDDNNDKEEDQSDNSDNKDDFNIGQFFSNHTRLTELNIESLGRLNGINLLTNLKSLNLSLYYHLDAESFEELVKLTQLKYLEFVLYNEISDELFLKISNLVNLEELELNVTAGAGPGNLKGLLTLPKLNSLAFSCPWAGTPQGSAAFSMIGQLTQLTNLNFENYYDPTINFNAIQGLTNLLELQINLTLNIADFSSLSKITKLHWRQSDVTKCYWINLPSQLASLTITHLDMDEKNIQDMCSLAHLKDLTMHGVKYNPSVLAQFITQLTTLTEIVITPTAPKELIAAFVHLPNLASLTFESIPVGIIDELAKLTQLIEVTYWKEKNKDLPAKMPFRVMFV